MDNNKDVSSPPEYGAATGSAETERLIRAFCEGARFAWEYFPGALGSEYDAEEVEREARTLARSNALAIVPNAPRLPDERSEDKQHAVVLPPDGLKCLDSLAWAIGRDDAAKGLTPARAENYRPDKAAMYMAGYSARANRQNTSISEISKRGR
jgi:hypothetical protein